MSKTNDDLGRREVDDSRTHKVLLPPINTNFVAKEETSITSPGGPHSATTSANHRRTESQLSTHSRTKVASGIGEQSLDSSLDSSLSSGGTTGSHESSEGAADTKITVKYNDDNLTLCGKLKKRYPNIYTTIGSILSWYLFSMTISFYNKWMFSSDKLDFSFPIIITAFHQLILTFFCILTLMVFPSFRLNRYDILPNALDEEFDKDENEDAEEQDMIRNEKLSYLMPPLEYIKTILPCSIASAFDIGLGNTAIRFITLTVFTMVKTSSLIFVLFWGVLLKLEQLTTKICLIVLIMTFSVILMIWGQNSGVSSTAATQTVAEHADKIFDKAKDFSQYGGSSDNSALESNELVRFLLKRASESKISDDLIVLGVMLVFGSACMSGLRWALTQLLLKKNKRTKNPILTMLYLSPGMSVMLFIMGIIVEGFGNFLNSPIWTVKGTLQTLILILIPGVLAFLMTISEFILLQNASLLTLSIAGIFKELLTIFLSWIIYGDLMSWINLFGLVITVLDILWYNHYRFNEKVNTVRDLPYTDIELDNFTIPEK